MSDIPKLPVFKIPPELLRELKDADSSLAQMKKNIDALKAIGVDVSTMEETFNTVSKARAVILEAFGQ